jgi:hypothetical protein
MNNKVLAAIAATMLLLSGCAVHNASVSSSKAPFYLAYDSEEVIRDQSKVATITSTGGLEIDGVEVIPKNMRSANYGGLKKQIVVADLLPGTHTVKITRNPSGGYVQMAPITYNFEAGKIYDIAITFIKVVVKENTSANVAQKIAENRNNAVFEKK